MLMQSRYVGDWATSVYDSRGRRSDVRLFLNPDGTYQQTTRREEGDVREDHGRWHHQDGESTLRLEPATSRPDDLVGETNWEVLSVTTCEDSNCLMVLRWIALASRNLPVIYYRIHLPGRWYSEALGVPAV
jgi:hypothetical protein